MESNVLKVKERKVLGGGSVNRLRNQGFIPAVVYGRGAAPIPVEIKTSELKGILSREGKNAFFRLSIEEGDSHAVVIKDIQYDALKNDLLHIDLQKVSLVDKINSMVPVRVTGRENAERSGGTMVYHLNEISVQCLPQDIPHYIEADISELTAMENLTVAQLKVSEKVTILSDPGEIVVSIVERRSAVEEPPEASEAPEETVDAQTE